MKITADEVRSTAVLARLALTDEETGRLTRELDAILTHMESLSAVDVTGIEPMTHAVALSCPERADVPGPQLGAELSLKGAPKREGPFFEVPRMIAHDKEGA